jgi:transposase
MFKTVNKKKNTNIFLKDKILRGVTGYKRIRFIEGYIDSETVDVTARLTLSYARCPLCGMKSHSVHSTYERQLMDLPIHGKRMNIRLLARKFRCRNLKCRQIVFSEQPSEIAERYSRKTIVAKSKLQAILIEMSATKGAVIVSSMGLSQSASTCLRLIKSIEIKVDKASIKHICIDDFAYRKGTKYGTIIIDADTRKTIALISSRETDHVTAALKAYPNVQTVSRDRSSAYANAIKQGIPEAAQIADKFHLVKNCGEHMEAQLKKSFNQIKDELSKQISEPLPPPVSSYPTMNNPEPVQLSRRPPSDKQRYLFEQVQKLNKENYSEREIVRHLHISRCLVRKYLSLNEPQGHKIAFRNDYSLFLPIVQNGIHNKARISEIYRNTVNAGLCCSYIAFLNWMRTVFPEYKTFKGKATRTSRVDSTGYDRTKSVLKALSSYKLNIYIANPEWGINKKTGECSKENIQMNEIIQSSGTLLKLREFCVSFKAVIAGNSITDIVAWIEKYKNESFAHLRTFAIGLIKDIDAVKNAIIYPYNNGLAEGLNNKLKALKRGMYGRAGNRLIEIKMVASLTG